MLFSEKELKMVFKKDDLEELTQGKKAWQSSISQWSKYNDAERAINNNLNIDDYAFHTAKEKEPWWIVDLEEEYELEYIYIENRKINQEVLKSIKIYYSIDGCEWFYIDSNLYNWQKLQSIHVYLNSYITARFVKIVLHDTNCLHFRKIQIYKRKIAGLIVATRYDGFGGRIYAMLNAMYLAKNTGMKFGYVWNERSIDTNNTDYINIASEYYFFEKYFIDKHSYTSSIKHQYPQNNLNFKGCLQNMSNKLFFSHPWGYACSANYLLDNTNIIDICDIAYKTELAKLWKNIPFSSTIYEIFGSIDLLTEKLGKFTVLHLRNGDTIDVFSHLLFFNIVLSRVFPLELALDIIEKELSLGNQIVLFSPDESSNELIYHIKANTQLDVGKIYTSSELCKYKTENELLIFDLYLMSKANKIIAPSISTYSSLAHIIGENTIIKIDDYLSHSEQIDIFYKSIEKINFAPKFKSSSYAYFIKKNYPYISLDEKIFLLQKGYESDKNLVFYMKILDEFFDNKQYKTIEDILINLYDSKKISNYINIFCGRTLWKIPYKTEINKYYTTASADFPYISFIASKIAFFQKDYKLAKKYCLLALEKNPNNILFLELLKELENVNNKSDIVNEIQLDSAMELVKNQLPYQIGRVIVLNHKSLYGKFKILFCLVKLIYNRDEYINLDIIELSKYDDYREAQELLNSFTYRLGEIIIQSSKDWYKGGYIKMWFKVRKLRKDINKKQGSK